jgi:TetR/AcrR family transcriptional regulator, transcriptional repressor for nem operon
MTRIIQIVGHSQDDKQVSHARIVDVAASRILEAGTEAPGVAEIMQAAGLTHGGFYKHFGSRDDLIREAASQAFDAAEARTEAALDGADDQVAAFADFYLSAEHRDGPARGCAVAGLGADAARGDTRVRAMYVAGVERYLARLEGLLGSREEAIVTLASLVGALQLARAIDDDELSDEILSGVRERLKAAH